MEESSKETNSTLQKTILIAEDERPLAMALQLKLKGAGFLAEHVANGEDVSRAVKEKKIDLILLDLIMPGKNGFQILTEFSENNIHIPVIVMSNLAQEEDIQKVEALGAKKYLVKSSVSLNEILEEIHKILEP